MADTGRTMPDRAGSARHGARRHATGRRFALAAALALPVLVMGPVLTAGVSPALAQGTPSGTAPAGGPTGVRVPAATGPTLPLPADMTLQEYQGLNCIAFGLTAATGVYIYSDVIVELLTRTTVNPYLLIPVLATGFAAGCSVGSTMSPGLLWIYSRF